MRNRPDFNYLTILGLSLTVVIAMQKGDSCQDSVRIKLSDADGHHVCFLSVDAVRDAFMAVSNEKSSFVFGQHSSTFVALSTPINVWVDGKGLNFTGLTCRGHIIPVEQKTREHISDLHDLLSLSLFHGIKLKGSNIGEDSRIAFYDSSVRWSAPVRAGPCSFI